MGERESNRLHEIGGGYPVLDEASLREEIALDREIAPVSVLLERPVSLTVNSRNTRITHR